MDYTPKQLRLPLVLEEIINLSDPVYTFDEVMKGCRLEKYLKTDDKDPRGRIGYDLITMLKVILFAFMDSNDYPSTRDIAKLCNNDILTIDGTKLEANANKYSWVWKKACITSRDRLYLKCSRLLEEINDTLLC